MSDIQAPTRVSSPVILKPVRDGGMGLVILTAILLAIAAVSLAVLSSDAAKPFFLTILAGLAVVGVFTLFAGAMGLIHIGHPSERKRVKTSYADYISDGLLVTSETGSVIYANDAFYQLFGYGDKKRVPTIDEAFAGNVAISDNIFRLSRAAARGEPWEEEFRVPRPAGAGQDSASKWYRVSVDRVPDEDGKAEPEHLTIWRVAEITGERARQEEAFQQLQEAIAYLDHAPAGFFSAGKNGRIEYMNATLAEWLGLDLADVVTGQMRLADIVTGDGAQLLTRAVEQSADPITHELHIDLSRNDGTSLPVRLLYQVVRGADGEPQTRSMVLNRSQGAERAEDLRAAEVRFARFFQSAPIAIAIVDSSGCIGNTNAAFARMFARTSGAPLKSGDSVLELIAPQATDDLRRGLTAAAAGQVDIPSIDIVLGKGGDRTGRIFVSPIDRTPGTKEAAILYGIDTTEQNALEIQIAQSQKMQAVGQLAGGIAHDFNNVLTAIIGFSDLLLTNHRPTDPAFKDIMNIKQNANRAAGLVRQLLAFSRQQTLRPEILSLTDMISDLQILLGRLLGEKVELKVSHGRDLWFVKVDLNQFEQVIINLAVNARDAMVDGGRLMIATSNVSEREISELGNSMIAPGDYVLLEVTDCGCGMPAEIIEKIFEPFFSTKEVGKGTGLGLSTVYGIIKQTGGYIFPDSKVGEGTTFRIYLPRQTAPEETAPAPRVEKREKPRDLTGSGCVLLVEDEEAVRSFAVRALASRGYDVLEASTGVEALAVMDAHEGPVDLVVSDVVMPEMDGPSLLKKLRKHNPDIKIIFISGYAEDAFRRNLEEDDEFVFLPKPFSLKQLAAAVKETLDG
ncbi:sensor kinase CckA [bacterium MnTg02]|nr:sensor kinase CckA [bacterium MnTg02]